MWSKVILFTIDYVDASLQLSISEHLLTTEPFLNGHTG
jgi:hypothetical protein